MRCRRFPIAVPLHVACSCENPLFKTRTGGIERKMQVFADIVIRRNHFHRSKKNLNTVIHPDRAVMFGFTAFYFSIHRPERKIDAVSAAQNLEFSILFRLSFSIKTGKTALPRNLVPRGFTDFTVHLNGVPIRSRRNPRQICGTDGTGKKENTG